LIDIAAARRLALIQLPIYRQIYSADFTLLDSYRLAKILLASEREQRKRKRAGRQKVKQILPKESERSERMHKQI
jgi:hypothetical protein